MKVLSSEIYTIIDSLIKIDRDDLFGTTRLSYLSFNNTPEDSAAFETVLDLLAELRNCNLERVPIDQLNQIKGQLASVKAIFDKAIALKLDHENPKGQRDAILGEVNHLYPPLFKFVAPIVAFANKAGTDFKRLERQAHDTLLEVHSYTEKTKTDLEDHKREAAEIINAMRSTAAESGVSQNSIHYSNAAKEHKDAAQIWLRWTIGFGVFLLIYTVVCLSALIRLHGSDKRFEFTYTELAMAVIFILIGFAINFSIKQYSTHRHNAVVNGDKARALATFLAFVKGTENSDVKDTVLQQASAAAFSMAPSGYLKGQQFLAPPLATAAQKFAERSLSGPPGNA